jgi:predicted transcriptional regulator
MKNEKFTIHAFMIDDLNLNGAKLLIYAMIFEMTNGGKDRIKANKPFFSNRLKLSKNTAYGTVTSLIEDGLVKEEIERFKGHSFKFYSINQIN